ncbi:hypothetical protein H0A36_24795 [Endozoicomonas sp. SM1973]|uniref:Uncharacterized protein n=1 Tax=Spartinivicinus marinus TaxID=2994442 RepID=A0A853IGV6_9GAMM|nr:hypothetical protein [Spartinivicinus marinus]MCX4024939.1 hypothetical protein [Spartinivicinus marinus]NYZ69241.1 hypothetical protein [Spartinivicinus marinus]
MKKLLAPLTLAVLATHSTIGSADEISFSYEGFYQPIKANVDSYGNISLLNYPTEFIGKLEYKVINSPLFTKGKLNAETCADVAEKIDVYEHYSSVPMLQKNILNNIRNNNTLLLHVTAAPFLTDPKLHKTASQAAVNAGIIRSSYHIQNNISFNHYDVSFDIADDANIKRLGNEEATLNSFSASINDNILFGGTSATELNALDLACDIFNEKVKVSIELKGYESNPNLKETILSSADIYSIKSYIESHPIEGIKDNKAKSYFQLGRAFENAAITLSNKADTTIIFNKLVSQETQTLDLDNEDLLANGITKKVPAQPYQGESLLKYIK